MNAHNSAGALIVEVALADDERSVAVNSGRAPLVQYGLQRSEPVWVMRVRVIERHIGTIAAFLLFPITWPLALLCLMSYVIRFGALDSVYHRYFSHRSYEVGRVTQFFLALIGAQCGQRGPLWWASKHREHHKHAETDRDPHSPVVYSVLHAGFRWFVAPEHVETNLDAIPDFSKYIELRWLNRFYWIPFYAAAALLTVAGSLGWLGHHITGLSAFLWGFEVPATIVLYMSAAVNVMNHLPKIPGNYRRYATRDTSTNRFLLGVVTCGVGFHNNHHAQPSAANSGVAWWEIDASYYAIRAMQLLGLARNVKSVPLARAPTTTV
jgi:stearoyl-CoA desaturase (Delta-9 desaturase)